MQCKKCEALIAQYRNLVSLFRNTVQKVTGAIGDDGRSEKLAHLRIEVDHADDALWEHWRKEHDNTGY